MYITMYKSSKLYQPWLFKGQMLIIRFSIKNLGVCSVEYIILVVYAFIFSL